MSGGGAGAACEKSGDWEDRARTNSKVAYLGSKQDGSSTYSLLRLQHGDGGLDVAFATN